MSVHLNQHKKSKSFGKTSKIKSKDYIRFPQLKTRARNPKARNPSASGKESKQKISVFQLKV
jgi:hypothetical protein